MSRRKPYVRPMTGWWRKNPFYVYYMLREGTSVLLALYAVLLIVGVASLAAGPESYAAWLGFVKHPLVIIFNLLVLVATLYHAHTWFTSAPKAMPPMRMGGQPVSDGMLVGGQYAATVAISVVILVLALMV